MTIILNTELEKYAYISNDHLYKYSLWRRWGESSNYACFIIQEGNYWGDKFWGICLKTNTGQNILGHLIMNIRTNLTKKG